MENRGDSLSRETLGDVFRSQGVRMTDQELGVQHAMWQSLWPLVREMRAVPLPYLDAVDPGHVGGWLAEGIPAAPDER